MADYDSALPIKGDRIDGATVDANRAGILFQGNDGSNYQDIAVNSSGHVLVDIQDSELVVNIEGDYVDDSAFTVGTDRLLAIGGIATSDLVDAGDVGAFSMTLARELKTSTDIVSVAGTAVDVNAGNVSAGTLRVVLATDQAVISIDDNGSSLTVDAVNLDIRDLAHASDSVSIGDGTDTLEVNADGSINVNLTDSTDPLWDYASANLVKDAATTVNSYSPSAGTDFIQEIRASGSGLMKVELLFGITASEAVIDVRFNSTSNPNVEFDMLNLNIASTETVIIRCTNLENSASPASDFSGYGTIVYRD